MGLLYVRTYVRMYSTYSTPLLGTGCHTVQQFTALIIDIRTNYSVTDKDPTTWSIFVTYSACYLFTAASHIEDLPIEQFPLNALEKLLKGPQLLPVHIILFRGTTHGCHHSVQQLTGAAVESDTLHPVTCTTC